MHVAPHADVAAEPQVQQARGGYQLHATASDLAVSDLASHRFLDTWAADCTLALKQNLLRSPFVWLLCSITSRLEFVHPHKNQILASAQKPNPGTRDLLMLVLKNGTVL